MEYGGIEVSEVVVPETVERTPVPKIVAAPVEATGKEVRPREKEKLDSRPIPAMGKTFVEGFIEKIELRTTLRRELSRESLETLLSKAAVTPKLGSSGFFVLNGLFSLFSVAALGHEIYTQTKIQRRSD